MKSSDPIALSTKHRLLLVLLALLGAVFVLLSTNRYGAGLSPDSVGYISIARNLIKGAGFISYGGRPLVAHPPLYPVLLALVGKICGTDPLLVAHLVNALIFGLIVYFGGLLTFKYLSSFPVFALAGTFAILASVPIFMVSTMAWSEPLFILFVVLNLLSANSYLEKKDIISLILLASSAALSFLTRYIGLTLILWDVLIIIVFCRDGIKNRIAHLSLFTLISVPPIGIWLVRNYVISNTLFGYRASSAYTLSQNLLFVFNDLMTWYIPGKITNHRPTLILLGMIIGFFTGFSLKDSWQSVKVILRQISPIILFVMTYTAFLVISSTTIAYDQIGDRLLSAIYVPLTLLLLILAQALVEPYRRHFSNKIMNSLLIIGLLIWLVHPIRATIHNAVNLSSIGQGYSSKTWIESETVQYLLQHQTLESECTIYTNDTDVTYILAHLATKSSPAETDYNSKEIVNDISRLGGSWPEGSKACLVWFDRIDRKYLFTIEELQTIANFDLMVRLEDGAIYSVTRK